MKYFLSPTPMKILLTETSFYHFPQGEGVLCALCRCIIYEVFSATRHGCVLVPL